MANTTDHVFTCEFSEDDKPIGSLMVRLSRCNDVEPGSEDDLLLCDAQVTYLRMMADRLHGIVAGIRAGVTSEGGDS